MWAQTLSSHEYWPLQWGVVIGASLVAAATDVWRRRIPNWLTAPVLLGGLIFAGVIGRWNGLADSLAGMALMMTPFVLLFLLAGGGAGDAKLMGALGTWLGLRNGVAALVAVCACGVLIGIVFSLARGKLRRLLHNLLMIVYGFLFNLAARTGLRRASQALRQPSGMDAVPYGIAIFLGVCAAAVKVMLWPSQ